MTAGSTGAPLARKLGIARGTTVGTLGAPDGFVALLDPMPEGASVVSSPDGLTDLIVVFAITQAELTQRFAAAMELLPANGGLWVGWPKRSSGIDTELTFDAVQRHGLEAGLVDNKVCAIDETWSGLRFVVRVEHRAEWPR